MARRPNPMLRPSTFDCQVEGKRARAWEGCRD